MKIEERPQVKRIGKLNNGGVACDLWTLPTCQATAKSTGKRCGNIAVKNKRVCYLHGGKSPGPPKGNKNALKHGQYTAIAKEEKELFRQLIRESREILERIG